MAFGIGGGGYNYQSNFYTISTNEWNHVVIIVGAKNESIYGTLNLSLSFKFFSVNANIWERLSKISIFFNIISFY